MTADGLPDDLSAWDLDAAAAFGGPKTDPGPTPMVSYALDYAARGLHTFPAHTINPDGRCSCARHGCPDIAKHPIARLVPHGLLDATVDPATIRERYATFHDANIAVRTGVISGLVVLDVDANGFDALEGLAASHGAPDFAPVTPTVATGGGGAHLWFRHPGPHVKIKTQAGQLGAGLDVRGDGGYVIAPPSLHASGNRYRWAPGRDSRSVPLADFPAWLLALVTAPPAPSAPHAAPLAEGELIADGQRNQTLTSLAGTMRRRGLVAAEMLPTLLAVNARRCRPPLEEDEVRKIAASVDRYAPAVEAVAARPRLRVREGGRCA